jgi:hypothetical protein
LRSTSRTPADVLNRLEGFDPDRLLGITRKGEGYLVTGDPLDSAAVAQLQNLASDEAAVFVRGLN